MNYDYLQNANPETHSRLGTRVFTEQDFEQSKPNASMDEREIFDYIRDIKDPEHPLSLEELGVVELDKITVNKVEDHCYVQFKPTIPHCSMATLIGLAIKVQLIRLLPTSFKIDVSIVPGTHVSDQAINKQLGDKERIAAALENVYLLDVINDCILHSSPQPLPKFIEDTLKEMNLLDHPKVQYIQQCRQPIESYRRWSNFLNSVSKSS